MIVKMQLLKAKNAAAAEAPSPWRRWRLLSRHGGISRAPPGPRRPCHHNVPPRKPKAKQPSALRLCSTCEEADTITDFNRAQGDVIAVNPIDADVTAAGDQAFTFIGTAPFTAAGQISYFTTATDTYIVPNTDGDAAQEMTIRLAGVHNVQADWFAL